MGSADPAPRMAKFLAGFDADRSSFTSICAPDLRAAMEKIATELARILGQQCLGAPLKDKDPESAGLQPDCVVEDRTTIDATASTYDYKRVPACQEVVCDPATAPGGQCKKVRHAEASPETPCWFIWPDQATCPQAGYQILIDRGIDEAGTNPQPPPGTFAVVQCSSCVADPSQDSYDCSPGCAGYWPGCCPEAQPGCFQ
jgi:hypothetical protein